MNYWKSFTLFLLVLGFMSSIHALRDSFNQKIFDNTPISTIKERFLEEDFNVDKFYNILVRFFGEEDLQGEIKLKQVTYYYLTTFTGKFLESEFNARTLGELRQKFVTTKKQAFTEIVTNGNFQQTFALCARQGRDLVMMKIKDIFKSCINQDFNQEFIQSTLIKASTNLDIIKIGEFTLGEIILKLESLGVNVDKSKHSIRELIIASVTGDGFLMMKPISQIVNAVDTLRVSKLTLQEILTEAINENGFLNKHNKDVGGLLSAWANTKDSLFTKTPVSHLLKMLTPEQLVKLSIGDVINRLYFPLRRPFLTTCSQDASLDQTIQMITKCVSNKDIFHPLGYSKVKSFTGIEIGFLTNGVVNPTMNIFQVLFEANKGFDKVIRVTAESLILLARRNSISLSALKSQTMETTLVQIFKVDRNIIRKVFSDINDETYQLVSMIPLQGLVNEDSGLMSVQELYTASVQTMAATVLAGDSSLEAIEKHLPRYVTLISGMTFRILFNVYETSPEKIMDLSLVDIVFLFFGKFSSITFKAIYNVNDQQFERIQKLTYKQAVDLINDPEKTSTLTKLIKYGAIVKDKCRYKDCGENGICINTDEVNGSAVCRCSEKLFFKEGKCKSTKQIIKVKGMKFLESYHPQYADRSSTKFVQLAERIEPILLIALKAESPSVEGIVIVSVTQPQGDSVGLIMIDVEVFVGDDKISPDFIASILECAVKNDKLDGLTPAYYFSASVDDSKIRRLICQRVQRCEKKKGNTRKCSYERLCHRYCRTCKETTTTTKGKGLKCWWISCELKC